MAYSVYAVWEWLTFSLGYSVAARSRRGFREICQMQKMLKRSVSSINGNGTKC